MYKMGDSGGLEELGGHGSGRHHLVHLDSPHIATGLQTHSVTTVSEASKASEASEASEASAKLRFLSTSAGIAVKKQRGLSSVCGRIALYYRERTVSHYLILASFLFYEEHHVGVGVDGLRAGKIVQVSSLTWPSLLA